MEEDTESLEEIFINDKKYRPVTKDDEKNGIKLKDAIVINGKKYIYDSEAQAKYNRKHPVEYISSLWTNKIPKLIAEKAKEKYLIWHYTEKEVGKWKRCSKCKCIKLAHNKFFSKNSTSKDGFYSICKSCRNKKK